MFGLPRLGKCSPSLSRQRLGLVDLCCACPLEVAKQAPMSSHGDPHERQVACPWPLDAICDSGAIQSPHELTWIPAAYAYSFASAVTIQRARRSRVLQALVSTCSAHPCNVARTVWPSLESVDCCLIVGYMAEQMPCSQQGSTAFTSLEPLGSRTVYALVLGGR
jgi:hypothetical protein